MAYLAHPPIQHLIQSLPLADHSVEVKAARWRDIFSEAGQQPVHDTIFAGRAEVRISRGWLRTAGIPNDPVRTAAILLWGYPNGARGESHRRWIGSLPALADAAGTDTTDWQEFYGKLHGIGNLGISTISKLAYGFGRQFGGHRALILDRRILSTLASGRWVELSALRDLTYGNAPLRYLRYLDCVSAVAAAGKFSPEQLELFLFALGDLF